MILIHLRLTIAVSFRVMGQLVGFLKRLLS